MSRLALATALAALLSAPALAETATVDMTVSVNQPSLSDSGETDSFEVRLDDSAVTTTLALSCSAGSSALFGLVRSDETCSLAGEGLIKNPQNPSQTFPRTKYAGGFTVEAERDGTADAAGLKVTYLAVGQVPASNAAFGGALLLLPENPGDSALALAESLLDRVRTEATGSGSVTINEEIDSVTLDGFATPSAGFPSDQGCTWTGNMLYAYATDAWVIDLTARCGTETHILKGNMPWIDVEDQSHSAEYVLNLTLPSGQAASDEGLFMTASPDNALFAAAEGISGTFKMTQSDFVTVEIGDATDNVAQRIEAEGTLTGTGVPLDVVRSLGHVFAVLSRTLFGA